MLEPAPRLSLVIPAYNEERWLPPLLESVAEASRRYVHGPGHVEVIVADNASTDGTARVAAEAGCLVVPVEKRCISAARNGGARIARGEVLLFSDADYRLHPETFNVAEETLATGRYIGGTSGIRPNRWSLGLAVTFAMIAPAVWLTSFDTGVVFCFRRDFEESGGYDESLLFAEDLRFLMALRKVGGRQGKKLKRITRVKAEASMRKFDEHGEWHYFTTVPKWTLDMVLKRNAFRKDAERYWYKPNR